MPRCMAKYFSDHEFRCKCGNCQGFPVHGISSKLLEILDNIRSHLNRPVIVTSGVRCPAHNASIGGSPNSYHIYGMAADIYCDHVSVSELASLARLYGATGVGVYHMQNFVHVDVRSEPTYWEVEE